MKYKDVYSKKKPVYLAVNKGKSIGAVKSELITELTNTNITTYYKILAFLLVNLAPSQL
ncbi:15659_t:CDS:2 [Dentiscutata heterogama]|uniref:15659_t:CDS:1 n=1 Tax=Dentiscutata heterogama TaxID=1316150 RepID=A0ACA9KRW0_9GLOM|nr:15659_t:CDS:2 [Dentiscutata heterogama]